MLSLSTIQQKSKNKTPQQHESQSSGEDSPRKVPSKKPKARLNLTYEELTDRISTIKDYSSYKKTKPQRINLKQCSNNADERSIPSELDVVYRYGGNDGNNVVLKSMIQDNLQAQRQKQLMQGDGAEDNAFHSLLQSQGKNRKERQVRTDSNPQFIRYKQTSLEKLKIYKIIEDQSKNKGQMKKMRMKTENNRKNSNHQKKKLYESEFPKELQKLKRQLIALPILNKRKNEQTINQLDLLIAAEENDSLAMIKDTVSVSKEDQLRKNNEKSLVGMSSRFTEENQKINVSQNRKKYLQNVRQILNKSKQCMEDDCEQQQLSRSQSKSLEKALKHLDKSSIDSAKELTSSRIKMANKLRYWPSYDRYQVSKEDNKRLNDIQRNFLKFMKQPNTNNPQTNQLLNLIEAEVQAEDSKRQKQVIKDQKESFNSRFKYKINLEHEKYKKNMKEFIFCKKAFRIEQQREEIRANGIKRLKNFNQNPSPPVTRDITDLSNIQN